MCNRRYIFKLKKHTKKKKTRGQKAKEREYLWKIGIQSVLLNYLIESWISPGCSYEFNVVYMKWEESQYLL